MIYISKEELHENEVVILSSV